MINHFHIQAQNRQKPKDGHNLLAIPQDVVTTTQLHNYRNYATPLNKVTCKGPFQKVKDPDSPDHVIPCQK
jgi:hypothetical protein